VAFPGKVPLHGSSNTSMTTKYWDEQAWTSLTNSVYSHISKCDPYPGAYFTKLVITPSGLHET